MGMVTEGMKEDKHIKDLKPGMRGYETSKALQKQEPYTSDQEVRRKLQMQQFHLKQAALNFRYGMTRFML
jgi:hypothetical protein